MSADAASTGSTTPTASARLPAPEGPAASRPADGPAVATGSGSLRMRRALLSLQQSRSALRAELVPAPQPPSRRVRGSALARWWWRRLRDWPATRVASEAVHQWWRRHPWQPLGDTLIGEVRGQLWPLVRRHPWATVGLSAALGAVIVTARPWRWAWVERQVRRAPGVASGWLVAQLSAAPVQAAIASLVALLAQRAGPPAAEAAGGERAAADPVSAGTLDAALTKPVEGASHVPH